MSDSVRPHRRQPNGLPGSWDSPGKNTGVGCHFLLHCLKAKSESAVAQSCPTLSDPMDCSPPGSSIHGIFQARVLKWGAIAFSECLLYSTINVNCSNAESFLHVHKNFFYLTETCYKSRDDKFRLCSSFVIESYYLCTSILFICKFADISFISW